MFSLSYNKNSKLTGAFKGNNCYKLAQIDLSDYSHPNFIDKEIIL